jgi:hypothetical protein
MPSILLNYFEKEFLFGNVSYKRRLFQINPLQLIGEYPSTKCFKNPDNLLRPKIDFQNLILAFTYEIFPQRV